jgi:hypothetical protein
LAGNRLLASPIRNEIIHSKSMIDLSEVFGIQDFAISERRRQISSFPSSMSETGSPEWPGLTRSCHFYEEKYFDLNYYHSFCKIKRKAEHEFTPILAIGEVVNVLGSEAVPKKKHFVYSAFL